MCKHKSGGMSKPSGAATHQTALSERQPACPSHSCSSQSDVPVASASQGESIPNSLSVHFDMQRNSQLKQDGELSCVGTAITLSVNESSSSQMHNVCMNQFAETEEIVNTYHAFQEMYESEYSDSSELDDDTTEQSPMLSDRPCEIFCPTVSWELSSNINGFKKYDGASNCFQDIILNNSSHSHTSSYDKFSSFKSYPILNNFQVPNSYISSNSANCTHAMDYNFKKYNIEQSESIMKHNTEGIFVCDIDKHEGVKHVNTGISVIDSCNFFPTRVKYKESNQTICSQNLSSVDTNIIPTVHLSDITSINSKAGPSGLQRPNSINCETGSKICEKDEFRCRSYSLTPTVNFAVFESESASESEDAPDIFNNQHLLSQETLEKTSDEPFLVPVSSVNKVFPISPSVAQLSLASSYSDGGAPICKICHMTTKENDPLISPCRCSGTMQYIHCGCLMRWLEISSKRSRKPASCELCQYQYHWHKKFKVRHWQFPHCSRQDKILHLLFFISMMVMIACATVTIVCFKQDRGTKVNRDQTELTHSEIVTLICGVMFFLAFFVAMYVEVKSHNTIYKLLVKFIYLNQQWYIDEYEKKDAAPVAV